MERDIVKDDPLLEGYEKVLKTIDIVKANRVGLMVMAPVFIIYFLPYYFVWKDTISLAEMLAAVSWINVLKWTIIYIAGIVAHELVHGITWAIFAKKGFKSIRFGVLWKVATPYCHCKEPLKIKHYLIGAITPFIFVGLIPGIYGIMTGSVGWLFFGIFFTVGAIGDFLIINLLRKEKMSDYALDHPSEAGCFVYRKLHTTVQ